MRWSCPPVCGGAPEMSAAGARTAGDPVGSLAYTGVNDERNRMDRYEELRAWASDRVPEGAAAPRAVTVLDTLPVTPVGKPFKPELRAEATREAVADAFRGVPTVTGVRGEFEGGAAVAVVGLAPGADETLIKEVLNRFALSWRLELS